MDLKQLILGNYIDDITLLGTIMQVLTGLIGTDLPADIRDLSYDITHFKPTKQHIFQTVLDTVALVPIVGAVKYIDEAGDIAKAGVKHGDEAVGVVKKSMNDASSKILKNKDIKEVIEPTSQSLDFWSNFWGSVQFVLVFLCVQIKLTVNSGVKLYFYNSAGFIILFAKIYCMFSSP